MQIIKNKEKIGNALFSTGLILELVVMMTDAFSSWTLPYRGRVTHIAFALFLIKVLTTRYEKKESMAIFLCGLLGVVSYFTCDDEYIVRCVMFVIAAKGIDIRKNLKIIFAGTLGASLLIVSLSLLGICGTVVDIRHYGRGVVEARYCLGFNHANNVHDMYWYLLCLYILIKEKKMHLCEYVVLTALNILLYMLTLSRTGVLTVQIVIVLLLICQYTNFVHKFNLVQIGCVLATIAVVWLTTYASIYNINESKLVARLDPLFTGRLEMLTEHANFKQWEWLPGPRSANMVDNGFSEIVYCYGMIVGLFLIIVLLYEIYVLIRAKNEILSIILLSSILIMFMEATFIINISLLCNMLLIVLMCNGLKESLTYEKSIANNTSV